MAGRPLVRMALDPLERSIAHPDEIEKKLIDPPVLVPPPPPDDDNPGDQRQRDHALLGKTLDAR